MKPATIAFRKLCTTSERECVLFALVIWWIFHMCTAILFSYHPALPAPILSTRRNAIDRIAARAVKKRQELLPVCRLGHFQFSTKTCNRKTNGIIII